MDSLMKITLDTHESRVDCTTSCDNVQTSRLGKLRTKLIIDTSRSSSHHEGLNVIIGQHPILLQRNNRNISQ